jgi:alpha-L-rhamnosidase
MVTRRVLRTSRRDFLKAGATGVAGWAIPARKGGARPSRPSPPSESIQWTARWIWFPEQRTLPSTFVFFRKEFELPELAERELDCWVTGNSRYKLYVNGKFVQRGPAPSDPRHWDVDPVDLRPYLRQGRNVVAGLVCHFGGGDGTYVPGTPVGLPPTAGFLFQAQIPTAKGNVSVATDESWQAHRARCWPAGNYQRWYLRALQESFDARQYPYGWNGVGFDASAWRKARILDVPAGRPVLREVPAESWQDDWRLTPRSIPLLDEKLLAPVRVTNAGWVSWNVPPEEYFDCFPPDAFREELDSEVVLNRPSEGLFPVRIAAPGAKSAVLTLDFGQAVAGYPFVRIRAPAGTTVEILYVETQDPNRLLLRTAPEYGQWVRLVTRQGETEFEAFDWDCFRFLQLAIRGSNEPVEILEAGVRQRLYPYPHHPDLKTSDAALNRAFVAAVNTHLIVAQDTLMDNVTRERQQYAGDVDHGKLASYYGFGEYRQPARMIRTFAQGQNDEGWFMDCWPAWDRCQRLWQKSLGLTQWGPIIDHGLGFVISTALYYLFSGDKTTIEAVYPQFLKFEGWLAENVQRDGMLPVTGWVRNSVWMDHRGWKRPEDKKAAFNIYYVGFLRDGMARLAEWLGDPRQADLFRQHAAEVSNGIQRTYWSEAYDVFVDNLPRSRTDKELRLHDRTLAMALLYGLFPKGREKIAVDLLANLPASSSGPIFPLENPPAGVGFSFPANAGWRLWALGLFGRGDAIVKDLRERWAQMPSLAQTNTFSENWEPRLSESGDVWCQNAPVVLYVLYGNVLGVWPTAPGFAEFDVRPQLGDLNWIEGTVHSPKGPIRLRCVHQDRRMTLSVGVPPNSRAALVFPAGAQVERLPAGTRPEAGPVQGTKRWRLPSSGGPKSWDFTVSVNR